MTEVVDKKTGEVKEFNPGAYLTQLQGRDYLEVKWRLLWLRTEHPDAVIETSLITDDGSRAVFHARVTLSTGAIATGHGSETYQDFNDYLEKAETKALGRALSALGYGTQFCDDHDFGGKDGRVVDSPVARGQIVPLSGTARPARQSITQQRPPAPQQGDREMANERQLKYLYSLMAPEFGGDRDKGIRPDGAALLAYRGGENTITKREATLAIDYFKARAEANLTGDHGMEDFDVVVGRRSPRPQRQPDPEPVDSVADTDEELPF